MEESLVEKCDYNTLAETKSLGAFLLQLCLIFKYIIRLHYFIKIFHFLITADLNLKVKVQDILNKALLSFTV
ncbi:hypothetical protein V1477_020561 [Vespula maculifrons]|uniref:Uncharacterized protein n=1 Tax=Vespula maculifrons TaxID=7453 RepID=A0ABD2AM92_VESMC